MVKVNHKLSSSQRSHSGKCAHLFSNVTFLILDDDKLEMEMKSDLNSDVWNLIPNVEDHHRHLQQLLDHFLDQQVAMTDMKYRHIVSKLIVVILSLFILKLLPLQYMY